jgi:3-oxoacyl-[acyl-carrier-protein] synthase II
MALDDAGFLIDDSNATRVGVNVGSGIGGLPMIEDNIREMIAKGPRRISPFFVPGSIINMVAGLISIQFGAKGPNVSMVSACTTSSHSIGEAGRMIEYGDADVMIAGGAEAAIVEGMVGGFDSMKALSRRNDDPAGASRPFDVGRDGFVIGEGAGVVLLESLEHAQARGVEILAELVGYGATADASHITLPAPGGIGAVRAARRALEKAGLEPAAIDHVNALRSIVAVPVEAVERDAMGQAVSHVQIDHER